MKAVVLSDNIPWNGLDGEWGLSIQITYRDKRILLDSGASGLFLENAEKLGIDLTQVDYAVLSHGHYDHSDGMETFFQTAANARFYVRPGCDAIRRRSRTGNGAVFGPDRFCDGRRFSLGGRLADSPQDPRPVRLRRSEPYVHPAERQNGTGRLCP